MNLVDYCKVPEYFDELKVGDKVMFIDYEGINPFVEYIEGDDISYNNKLYEITEIKRKDNCNGILKCTTNYLCITVRIDSNFGNENFICCNFSLANKLGQKLKPRKYTHIYIYKEQFI